MLVVTCLVVMLVNDVNGQKTTVLPCGQPFHNSVAHFDFTKRKKKNNRKEKKLYLKNEENGI